VNREEAAIRTLGPGRRISIFSIYHRSIRKWTDADQAGLSAVSARTGHAVAYEHFMPGAPRTTERARPQANDRYFRGLRHPPIRRDAAAAARPRHEYSSPKIATALPAWNSSGIRARDCPGAGRPAPDADEGKRGDVVVTHRNAVRTCDDAPLDEADPGSPQGRWT